jgi:hypothetical protein
LTANGDRAICRKNTCWAKSGNKLAIKKKYEDVLTVGGLPNANLEKAMLSLERAGFKKINKESPFMRVKGSWKPIIGTLFGDITLDFEEATGNTKIYIVVIAAVDNAFALVSSPGERLKVKFLEEFKKVSLEPVLAAKTDASSKLENLEKLKNQGAISEAEYSQARINIISGK